MKFFIVSAHVEHELGNNIFFFFYMIDGKKVEKAIEHIVLGSFMLLTSYSNKTMQKMCRK